MAKNIKVTRSKKSKSPKPIRRRRFLDACRLCFVLLMIASIAIIFVMGLNYLEGGWRVLFWVLLVLWLITIVEVVYCRFFNPFLTPLMVQRWFQQRKDSSRAVIFERKYVPISQISPYLINAADVAENMGYFQYSRGFLFKALSWAYELNQTTDSLRGGSIISQQTAKNCFLLHNRNMLRKLVEAYYVLLMEFLWGKKRIMECYLNIIEYGDGIYGCEAASQHYFGHSAATLTEREAVMLAAALPAPLSANPEKPSPKYEKRVEKVLSRLQNHEAINFNARYEDLDIAKLKEGNRGLLFFIWWLIIQKFKGLRKENTNDK